MTIDIDYPHCKMYYISSLIQKQRANITIAQNAVKHNTDLWGAFLIASSPQICSVCEQVACTPRPELPRLYEKARIGRPKAFNRYGQILRT